jgi:hypothetical protein
MLHIDDPILVGVRKVASDTMFSSLFKESLYPAAKDNNNMAIAAYGHAIEKHPEHGIRFLHIHSITHGSTQRRPSRRGG